MFLPVIYYLVEKKTRLRKASIPIVLALLGFFNTGESYGQEISMQMAIDSTLINNSYIKNAELTIEQAMLKKQASLSLGTTNLNYTHGQINTGLPDSYWQINQNLGNPLKQIRQSGESKALIEVRNSELYLIRRQLIYDLKLNWYSWIYAHQLIKLYDEHINIFSDYLPKARYKEEVGEISKAELYLIEVQLSNLENEVATTRIMLNDKLVKLHEITHIKGTIEPPDESYEIIAYIISDTVAVNNALLNYQKAKLSFSEKAVNTAKSEFFPELSIGYFNQSIDKIKGFQGITAGIYFPLWFVPKSKAIKIARLNVEMARNDYGFTEKRLNLLYEKHSRELREYLKLYNKYGINWKGQLNLLLEKAAIQLDAGEIDYFRFIQLYSQSIDIEIKRLKLINNINQSIIHLEYYQNR